MQSLQILATAFFLIRAPDPPPAEPAIDTSGPDRSEASTAAPMMDPAATAGPEDSAAPTPTEAPDTDEPEGIVFADPGTQAGPTSAAPAPAVDRELPPRQATRGAAEAVDFFRRAPFVGLSTGVMNCGQVDCYDIVVGGLGRLDFGDRFGVPALVFGASVGGARLSPPSEYAQVRGRALFFDVGGGIQLFPVRTGRVDPFIDVRLGYARMQWSFSNNDETAKAWYSRGAASVGTGINIYVAEVAAIGPRVNLLLPFAGELCSSDPDGTQRCDSLGDLVGEGADAYERRGIRRSFAKPWSVTLNLICFLAEVRGQRSKTGSLAFAEASLLRWSLAPPRDFCGAAHPRWTMARTTPLG